MLLHKAVPEIGRHRLQPIESPTYKLYQYTLRQLNYFVGDAHIYENHLDMQQEPLLLWRP